MSASAQIGTSNWREHSSSAFSLAYKRPLLSYGPGRQFDANLTRFSHRLPWCALSQTSHSLSLRYAMNSHQVRRCPSSLKPFLGCHAI